MIEFTEGPDLGISWVVTGVVPKELPDKLSNEDVVDLDSTPYVAFCIDPATLKEWKIVARWHAWTNGYFVVTLDHGKNQMARHRANSVEQLNEAIVSLAKHVS